MPSGHSFSKWGLRPGAAFCILGRLSPPPNSVERAQDGTKVRNSSWPKVQLRSPKNQNVAGPAPLLKVASGSVSAETSGLREVAEKQGKHIPKEYAEKDGSEFDKERAARNEAKEMAPMVAALAEATADDENLEEIPDAKAPLDDAPIEEEQDATYPGE